jgi:hypothetical protein
MANSKGYYYKGLSEETLAPISPSCVHPEKMVHSKKLKFTFSLEITGLIVPNSKYDI